MQNIVVVGSGGYAKVIIDIIEKTSAAKIVGLIDSHKPKGRGVLGRMILGTECDLPQLTKTLNIHGCILAIGDNHMRQAMKTKIDCLNLNLQHINAIHPTVAIACDVNIGQGTVIMANTNIGSSSQIGEFCILNTNSSLDHDGTMGNFSSLAPGVVAGGGVQIGTHSAIGLGANILHGVSIGENSVIGAGSLVNKNIDSFVVAYGQPCQYVRDRKSEDAYLS